jgi:simple sugar transport system ATP-binding protein
MPDLSPFLQITRRKGDFEEMAWMSEQLEMRNISISFPGVKALDNVSFSASTGEVHALAGANGAGKSTLMKILSGAYAHYTGEILINGQPVHIRSPRDARQHGIEIVFQEVDVALIPYLTVAENIMIDDLVNAKKRSPFVYWRKIRSTARQVLARLGENIDCNQIASSLSIAQKQLVLIARALVHSAKFLVLDEPTAPLSQSETDALFKVIQDLVEQGLGIIYISHRMPEIFRVCSRITILRDGKTVDARPLKELNYQSIVEKMLGRKLGESFPVRTPNIGEELFSVKGLSDGARLRNARISVRRGEIVGLTGLVGAGKTEFCKAIFGATRSVCASSLWKGGSRLPIDPHYSVRMGMALIPEERRKEGLFLGESVADNITIASLHKFSSRAGFVRRQKEFSTSNNVVAKMGIKCRDVHQTVANLSGGNQQKVVVGKWLCADAELYIFDEPTKGIDVGAKKDLYGLIGALADSGKAVIYASCEFEEILGLCDRIFVLYAGETVAELKSSEANEEKLLYYSTGGR